MDRLVIAVIEEAMCEQELLEALRAQDKFFAMLAKRRDADGENIRDYWKHTGVAD